MRSLLLIGSFCFASVGCAERASSAISSHSVDAWHEVANVTTRAPAPSESLTLRPIPNRIVHLEPVTDPRADAGQQPVGSVPPRPNEGVSGSTDDAAASAASDNGELAAEPGYPNDDTSDDHVVGPPDVISDCEERLTAAKVIYRHAKLPVHKSQGLVCGTEQAVIYLRGPTGLRIQPQPVVSCGLAIALAHFEQVLDRTAQEFFGSRVVTITQGGTYNCRSMARFRWVSEHSYANAIDLYEFGLANGRRVNVLRDFGSPKESAKTAESKFLRELAHRAYDEKVFSVVVTRFFDELHRNHIHVDMARYRTDGSR